MPKTVAGLALLVEVPKTVGGLALLVEDAIMLIGRFFTASCLLLGAIDTRAVEGLEAVEGLLLTLDLELLVVGLPVVAGLLVATLIGRPGFMIDSRALLVLVWRTVGVLFMLGAGRALKAFFFCSSASLCCRASLAALNLAATTSPGSWKLL